MRTIGTGAILLASALCLGGCLLTSSNATYETGRRVSPGTLDQIQLGETSEAWLIATLGEPQTRTEVADHPGVEILRYDYSEHHESDGALFLVFAGSTRRTTTSTTFFEVANGVITKYWTE